jgi:hypothetical protein
MNKFKHPRRWTLEGMKALYPTEQDRAKHRAWLVLHCQARFRGEECDITESEFFDLWAPHWAQRGRHSDDLTMTRIDDLKPWTRSNVEIITRKQHLRNKNNLGNIKCE